MKKTFFILGLFMSFYFQTSAQNADVKKDSTKFALALNVKIGAHLIYQSLVPTLDEELEFRFRKFSVPLELSNNVFVRHKNLDDYTTDLNSFLTIGIASHGTQGRKCFSFGHLIYRPSDKIAGNFYLKKDLWIFSFSKTFTSNIDVCASILLNSSEFTPCFKVSYKFVSVVNKFSKKS